MQGVMWSQCYSKGSVFSACVAVCFLWRSRYLVLVILQSLNCVQLSVVYAPGVVVVVLEAGVEECNCSLLALYWLASKGSLYRQGVGRKGQKEDNDEYMQKELRKR